VLQAQGFLRLLRRGSCTGVFPSQGSDAHGVALPKLQADSAGQGKQRDCKNPECGEAVSFVTAITGFPRVW